MVGLHWLPGFEDSSKSPDSSGGRALAPEWHFVYRGFESHRDSTFVEAHAEAVIQFPVVTYVILAPRRTTIKEP